MRRPPMLLPFTGLQAMQAASKPVSYAIRVHPELPARTLARSRLSSEKPPAEGLRGVEVHPRPSTAVGRARGSDASLIGRRLLGIGAMP